MSRQLPARPSLEHLRKQAKDLLPQLRQKDPAAQLADAQHALAREYGFASWPKLKAHVDLQPANPALSPFAGLWNANLSKSRRHPLNQFQRATMRFEVDADTVSITDVVVDEAGREERRVNTIRADGDEHAAAGGHGYSVVATWRDPRTLETTARQHGEVVGAARYEVSADGRTLTITAADMFIVLDRAHD